jgi:hypothetical protein
MATSTTGKSAHVDVRSPEGASLRQQRELTAFARYCVQRIEKELGPHEWLIEITMTRSRYGTFVQVMHDGLALEVRGEGDDGPLAIWDAMCRIEQELREQRVVVTKPAAND